MGQGWLHTAAPSRQSIRCRPVKPQHRQDLRTGSRQHMRSSGNALHAAPAAAQTSALVTLQQAQGIQLYHADIMGFEASRSHLTCPAGCQLSWPTIAI